MRNCEQRLKQREQMPHSSGYLHLIPGSRQPCIGRHTSGCLPSWTRNHITAFLRGLEDRQALLSVCSFLRKQGQTWQSSVPVN